LVTVLTGHRDDQIDAVKHDLSTADANTVDALFNDLPSLIERLA
jgi:hypothetical protein